MTDTTRDVFEAWARAADMPLGMYSATDYADGATQISWDAWQACAAASVSAGGAVAWRETLESASVKLALIGQIYAGDKESRRLAEELKALAAHPAPSTPAVPEDVRRAVERMCMPLDESRLTGVTAQEDARCMRIIRDYVLGGATAAAIDDAGMRILATVAAPAQPAVPEGSAAAFIRDVAAQTPEQPDYWSSCGQCGHNIERAQDLLDAPAQSCGDAEQADEAVTADARDAGRYRWLRQQPIEFNHGRVTPVRPDKLDAIIDAARAKDSK